MSAMIAGCGGGSADSILPLVNHSIIATYSVDLNNVVSLSRFYFPAEPVGGLTLSHGRRRRPFCME